jgi:hypothetical protein
MRLTSGQPAPPATQCHHFSIERRDRRLNLAPVIVCRRRGAVWRRRGGALWPGAGALHPLHLPHPPLRRPAGPPPAAGRRGRPRRRCHTIVKCCNNHRILLYWQIKLLPWCAASNGDCCRCNGGRGICWLLLVPRLDLLLCCTAATRLCEDCPPAESLPLDCFMQRTLAFVPLQVGSHQ